MSSIGERGSDGLTLLHRAVKTRDVDLCRDLLQQGAHANARSGTMVEDGKLQPEWSPGETPLILAARTGDFATVELLLEHGADALLCDCNEWGPLHSAVIGGDTRTLELLISAGADVNVKSSWRSFDEQCHHQYEIAQSHQAELRTWELSCEALRRPRADATLVSSPGGGDWCTTGIPSCCYSTYWSRGSGSEPSPSS